MFDKEKILKIRFWLALLLIAFAGFSPQTTEAQTLFDGTVIDEGPEQTDGGLDFVKNVIIYNFPQKQDALDALRQLNNNRETNVTGYAKDWVVPNNAGDFKITADVGDYLLVWCKDLRYVSPIIAIDNNTSSNIRISLRFRNEKSNDNDTVINLGGVDVLAKRVIKKTFVSSSEEKNGVLVSDITIPIPIENIRISKNIRVTAQPVWYDRVNTFDEESDTIFAYGKPVFIDFSEYKITQERRMNFNLYNDSLYNAVAQDENKRYYKIIGGTNDTIKSNLTFSKEKDTLFVQLIDTVSGHDPDGSHPYPFGATVAISDYNSILYYHTEKDNGERRCPLKFLDFSFRKFLPNPNDFFEKMNDTKIDVSGALKLNFLVGKAILAPDDTASHTRLQELRQTFTEIEQDNEKTLVYVYVFGVASPEGNIKTNEELALRRAQFAVNAIQQFTSRPVKIQPSRVATWNEVADSLANDGYTVEAQAVRTIVEQYPGQIESQGYRIAKLDCYNTLIKETYLPKLRMVRYEYRLNKIGQLGPQQIWAQYHSNHKTKFKRGEFWALFNFLNDKPDELEEVTKYALQETKAKDEDSVYCKGYWPYAACLLACCYIDRDTSDINLLTPFLDLRMTGDSVMQSRKSFSKRYGGRIVDYVNFPEVAANQMIMILKHDNRSYRKQLPILEAIIKGGKNANELQYDTLLAFSQCLRGEYKDKKTRDLICNTSLTNRIILDLAMDEEYYLNDARNLMEDLPDNAVSDYLKAIIALRYKEIDKATDYLSRCFMKDITKMAVANNDKDLIPENGQKLTVNAYNKWKKSMNDIVAQDENHPFFWFLKAITATPTNTTEAKESLFKCFELDNRYISVLNVALKCDSVVSQNKNVTEMLKSFKEEYMKGRKK